MVSWIAKRGYSPIGIDLGSRSVKLLQFNADRTRLLEAARWDLPAQEAEAPSPEDRAAQWVEAIRLARQGRNFRGREAVLCLGGRELFVQNIRVTKAAATEMDKVVQQEAASRVPFSIGESELRYLEAGDVRQGEAVKREVILLACHKPVLQQTLAVIEKAGLRPVAVDVEPNALLRCYARQFRRDEDRTQRAMFVHVGAASTVVVIAKGADPLFIKYIDVGGLQMDEAVARHLDMDLADATALRRNNGDRHSDGQDPEVTRSVQEAVRGVVDRLATELSMCARYHSVTFRGQPLARVVLGGGEATPALLDALSARLDSKCELGDPLRTYEASVPGGRRGQWDIAAGLALKDDEQEQG